MDYYVVVVDVDCCYCYHFVDLVGVGFVVDWVNHDYYCCIEVVLDAVVDRILADGYIAIVVAAVGCSTWDILL